MVGIEFSALVERFRCDGLNAIALMGSFARGDAGTFSDIDLVRFHKAVRPERNAETRFVDGMFIVVSDVTPSQVEVWFTDPDSASSCIAGVRSARALWDPQSYFAAIQRRAGAFIWDESMQTKANTWAGSQMVGWVEEVQKGLEGLLRDDEGRLLNARFGLSWGMLNVMRVQRGILITGDNTTFSEVTGSIGQDSEWTRLCRLVFGIAGNLSLREQVVTGLHLYVLTAEMLAGVIKQEHAILVNQAVLRIKSELL